MNLDDMADRAHQNPYESERELVTFEDHDSCEYCGRTIKLLRDADTGEIADREHCEFHLRVVCSWCKKAQGLKACDEQLDGQITHTICDGCGAQFRKAMEDKP